MTAPTSAYTRCGPALAAQAPPLRRVFVPGVDGWVELEFDLPTDGSIPIVTVWTDEAPEAAALISSEGMAVLVREVAAALGWQVIEGAAPASDAPREAQSTPAPLAAVRDDQ